MAINLEHYLQKFNPTVLKSNELALDCPVCGREGKLQVNTDRGVWHCWICEEYALDARGKRRPVKGAGGPEALVAMLEGCSLERAKMLLGAGLGEVFGGGYAPERPRPGDFQAIPAPPGARPIPGTLPYCEQRGITPEDIKAFGLFFCDSGRYRNRLIFPAWENGRLLFWQARAMWTPAPGESYQKSLNPPKIEGGAGPADVLFNLDVAKQFPRVAITEGPIDAVHTGPSAVCTWGKKISMAQVAKLRNAGVRAVDLIWDGPGPTEPEGAWPEMMRAAPLLAGVFDLRLVFLPAGDPGNYSRHEIEQFRAHARPVAGLSRLAAI